MIDHPLVSVIIPGYNTGTFIAETLEGVLGQTYGHREIIVVDDGSTDDTEKRIKPYLGRIRYIRHENAGAAEARNAGLHAARGDYIAFLDADDLWLPEKLQIQLQVAARHPESRMIVCDGVVFGDVRVATERLLKGPLAARLDREPTGELIGNFYRDLIQRNAISCPAQTLVSRAGSSHRSCVGFGGLVAQGRDATGKARLTCFDASRVLASAKLSGEPSGPRVPCARATGSATRVSRRRAETWRVRQTPGSSAEDARDNRVPARAARAWCDRRLPPRS